MDKKEFVVFGLGRFGKSVAKTLADSGCEVLVVDDNEDNIQDIADSVTYAVCADVCDADMMKSLGVSNFDGAVVAIGENMEASVMVTILAKELGIPYVLAKAKTEMHAKVLKKVGADLVVFPEKETGIRIANNLVMGNFFNAIELSTTTSVMEMDVPKEWAGKSLAQLNVRVKYRINVVAVRHNGSLDITPDANECLDSNDQIVVIGHNDVLNKLMEMDK